MFLHPLAWRNMAAWFGTIIRGRRGEAVYLSSAHIIRVQKIQGFEPAICRAVGVKILLSG